MGCHTEERTSAESLKQERAFYVKERKGISVARAW